MRVWKHVVLASVLGLVFVGCGDDSSSDGRDVVEDAGGGADAGDAVGDGDGGHLPDVDDPDGGSGPQEPVETWSLYLDIDPADLEELYNRHPNIDDRVDTAVRVGTADGPELDVQGLRFRGSSTRHYAKKSYNIKLNERPELDDYPTFNFRSEQRDAGNRLVLNAMWTDPSAMRETLTLDMYRVLGLPSPATYYVDLYINGNFEGLYLGVERIDREALKGWGLERKKGSFTMVRDETREFQDRPGITARSMFGVDIDAIGESDEERIELLQEIFKYRGELEDTNWTALLELIRWAYQTEPGEQWAAEFGQHFDEEKFIDFMAINALSLDQDAFDSDVWYYIDETEGDDARWQLIPWDMDMTFGSHWFTGFSSENDFFAYDMPLVSALGNSLVDKFMQTSALKQRMLERMGELMKGQFNIRYYRNQVARIKAGITDSMAIRPGEDAFVRHPSQHYAPPEDWEARLDSLIDFVELRHRYIDRHVNPIRGENYKGGLKLSQLKAGDVIFITDVRGWTIARLELDEDVQNAEISASVSPAAERGVNGVSGVDRLWEIKTSGAQVSGKLSLYYRNTPRENWYEEEDEAVGRQAELVIAEVQSGSNSFDRLSTQVNPFSNRAEASVTLSGEQRFVLTFPED